MPPAAMPVRGIYLLTPDEPDTGRLADRIARLLPVGPVLLQYRNKHADAALRRAQVRALLPLCAAHGVPLVVNDDWRLAAEAAAAGVHLGGRDDAVGEARRVLGPDAIVGASCYDSLPRAEAASADGASYLAFGACFPSATKPDAARAPLTLLAEAARFGRPRVAIGGITADNAPLAIAAGADLLAVIGSVHDAADPPAALRALVACFERGALARPASPPSSPHA